MELLVAVAIVVVLAAIAFTVMGSMRNNADLARATEKIKSLGAAFVGYTTDHGGLLPYEDAPGSDDWTTAAQPEALEAWYNALPVSMGAKSVGDIGKDDPEQFYQDTYPLYVPGAPYPKSDKKLTKPMFAIAMSSRLQRKGDDGFKAQGSLASIIDPVRTVVFLERGMPGDQKVNKAQTGFDAGPKANPRAFAGRHNQKGILLFADGHTEVRAVSDLITSSGMIIFPQERVIWTADPEEDPN
jgi:prepilin-type processing-associated H-X9-DG protein